MSLYLPRALRWLGWIAGAEWPDGDEDKMWAVSRAWDQASTDLSDLITDIEMAERAAMAAYASGDGRAQIGKLFDVFLVGDQSLQSIIDSYRKVSESTFDVGTELQATKISIIVSLALLAAEIAWAWLFPPTAPAVEAAAYTTTRSWMKIIGDILQNAMERAWSKLGFATRTELTELLGTSNRYFWKNLAEYVVNKGTGARLKGQGAAATIKGLAPSAKGMGVYTVKLGETAMWGPVNNAMVQEGQIGQGKRRGFDWTSFGAAAAGTALGTIPSREFGRGFGGAFRWLDEKSGGKIANSYRFGPIGVGALTGASSAVFSNIFASLGVGAVTGDMAGAFGSGPGWVGAASRGGIVGGVRGGSTKMTTPDKSDPRFGFWMHNKAGLKDSFEVSARKFFFGENWNPSAKCGSTTNSEMAMQNSGRSTNSGMSGTDSVGTRQRDAPRSVMMSSSRTGSGFDTNGHGFVHGASSGSGLGGNGRNHASAMFGGRGPGAVTGPGGAGGGIGLRGNSESDDGSSSSISYDGSKSSTYPPAPTPESQRTGSHPEFRGHGSQSSPSSAEPPTAHPKPSPSVLGLGKDLRGKSRPKRVWDVDPLPSPFHAPTAVAAAVAWLDAAGDGSTGDPNFGGSSNSGGESTYCGGPTEFEWFHGWSGECRESFQSIDSR
ncbi:MAG: hypothetical protein J2P17_00880 [Mycobacterium sp.]|nr:hypothetical protein [Mycobacterium sp.]